MDGMTTVADSHEWERRCKQLLVVRYRDELQLIDASKDGDMGLEAFTRITGYAFQSYAPLEPLTTEKRYEKHRDKLTTDLNKLVTNAARLAEILGTTKISRYFFMVPQFDTRLLDHCAKKRDQICDAKLVFIADDFEIYVHTEADYPGEIAQLIELAIRPLRLDGGDLSEHDHADWAEGNLPLVETLNGKLAKLGRPEPDQIALRDDFLKHYLRREQLLQQIFDQAPETHVRLLGRIREREQLLNTQRLLSEAKPLEHARNVIAGLKAELLEESKALQEPGAEALAYGTADDWLLRCPLDFPESN